MSDKEFKICPCCGFKWNTREEFIEDKNISIVGYQVSFKLLGEGAFLFNHSCKGTMALKVRTFADLYKGSIYKKRATGTDECPGYCLYQEILDSCQAECECAYVREILKLFKKK